MAHYVARIRLRCAGALRSPTATVDHAEVLPVYALDHRLLDAACTYRRRQFIVFSRRYSNPDIVSRLNRILSGQGRDRPSHRPVPSVRQQQTRLTDPQRSELLDRYLAGEPATALAKEFGVHRATVFSFLRRAGLQDALSHPQRRRHRGRARMYEAGQSLAVIGEALRRSRSDRPERLSADTVYRRGPGTNQWSPRAPR